MQRNLQMVVNRLNAGVGVGVVILVVLFTVVSSVRVIGMESISTSVWTGDIIAAVPEIAGVVVVNPGSTVHVPVRPGVVPPALSKHHIGNIRGSRYLDRTLIGRIIEARAETNDGIGIAAIEKITIPDMNAACAGRIAQIDAAPISVDYIDDDIAEIAAARIIGGADGIEMIS